MSVVLFRGHRFQTRDDGLGFCLTCHGAEIELTTHCCMRLMTDPERASVTEDELDFRDGQWTQPGPVEYQRRKRTYR